MRISFKKISLFVLAIVFILGLAIPQNLQMPVEGATSADYNEKSFWYYPWGKSVTHKGVDIFAKKGTNIFSSTKGLVLFSGSIAMGGKVIIVLGPKWRLHYYAHLESIINKKFSFIDQNTPIGTVGDSGNAKGKSPHLHYSIITLIPYPWQIDNAKQGWRKMFYLNPIPFFRLNNFSIKKQ